MVPASACLGPSLQIPEISEKIQFSQESFPELSLHMVRDVGWCSRVTLIRAFPSELGILQRRSVNWAPEQVKTVWEQRRTREEKENTISFLKERKEKCYYLGVPTWHFNLFGILNFEENQLRQRKMTYCLSIRALLFARIKKHPVASLEGALDLTTYLH